jgi:DNA excision repair protein ERCC-1
MLTSVKSVNKTDVTTLLGVFGNISNICAASETALVVCPGLGERKVKRLHSALNVSFVKKHKSAANVQTVITKVPAKVPSTAEKDIDEVD